MCGTQYAQMSLASPEKLRRASGTNSCHAWSPLSVTHPSVLHMFMDICLRILTAQLGQRGREGSPYLTLPAAINHSEEKIQREWLGVFHLMKGSEQRLPGYED